MANYKGHISGGLIAGLGVAGVYYALPEESVDIAAVVSSDWQFIIGLITVSVLFALFPDVDTNSKAQNLFYSIIFTVDVILILTGLFTAAALLGLLAMTPIIGKHRGWTHKKLTAFILPLPIIIIPYLSTNDFGETNLVIYAAAVAGYLSHLLLDGLIWKRIRVRGSWR